MKKLFIFLAILFISVASFSVRPTTQAQEDVEIVFSHIFSDPNDVRGQVVQQIVDAFMAEHPSVTVTLLSNTPDYRELFNNSMMAAEQGNAPHIVQVDESITQLAVDSQLFLPIQSLASDEQLAELENFLPQVLDFYSLAGTLWGIPWNTSNPVLYYNVDMFIQAGLDPNDPPSTFDEMLAACEVIVNAGIEGLDGCINFPLVSWFPEQWLAMQNVLLVDNDNGRNGRATEIYLTSPEMVEIVTWWKTMADNGYYIYSGRAADYNGEAIIFLGKSSAMHINSTAGLTNFLTYSEVQNFELGVAPLIKPHEDATHGVSVGGASLMVTAGHSDVETQAAVDFVFFLASMENNLLWHQGTGYIPNRVDTIAALEESGWFEENPFFLIALDQLRNSELTPATAGIVLGAAAQSRGAIEQTIQTVIDGGEDPEEALAAAKGRIDADIQDYNSLFE